MADLTFEKMGSNSPIAPARMPEQGVVCAAPFGTAYATPGIHWGGGASSNDACAHRSVIHGTLSTTTNTIIPFKYNHNCLNRTESNRLFGKDCEIRFIAIFSTSLNLRRRSRREQANQRLAPGLEWCDSQRITVHITPTLDCVQFPS